LSLSLSWWLLLLSSANIVVVADGAGVLGAVAFATPANIKVTAVRVMPNVLRMFAPQNVGHLVTR
jgi:hypothetical protein